MTLCASMAMSIWWTSSTASSTSRAASATSLPPTASRSGKTPFRDLQEPTSSMERALVFTQKAQFVYMWGMLHTALFLGAAALFC